VTVRSVSGAQGWAFTFHQSFEEGATMGAFDKAKDKAEQLVGKGKESAGRATDDQELEDAGKRDQLSGEAKEAGHDVRDKAAGAVHDAREALRGDDK
jgi:uncharacterized protein YjbJ (UPF0337 family)